VDVLFGRVPCEPRNTWSVFDALFRPLAFGNNCIGLYRRESSKIKGRGYGLDRLVLWVIRADINISCLVNLS